MREKSRDSPSPKPWRSRQAMSAPDTVRAYRYRIRIGYRLPPRLFSCYELGDNPLNLIIEYLLILYLITLSVRAYRYRIRIRYRLPPRLPSYYELGDNPLNLIVEYLLVLYLITLSVRAYRLNNSIP